MYATFFCKKNHLQKIFSGLSLLKLEILKPEYGVSLYGLQYESTFF